MPEDKKPLPGNQDQDQTLQNFGPDSFRLIFECNPLPMYIYDVGTFRFQDVNPAAVRQYGYSKEEFSSMTIFDIRHAEDVLVLKEFLTEALQKFTHEAEWKHLKKDGTVIWVEVESHEFVFNGVKARLVFAKDITARKNTENELFSSKEFAERINHTVPDILYIFDSIERKNVFCNRSIFDRAGYTPEEIIEMGTKVIETVIYPDDYPAFIEHQGLYLGLNDGDVIDMEYRMILKGGGFRWFRSSEAVFKRDSGGAVCQVIGLCRDITERKTAEEASLASEARYRLLAEHSSDMICLLDEDLTLQYVSPSCSVIIGHDPEELIGQKIMQFVHPDEQILVGQHFSMLKDELSACSVTYRFACKGGDYKWLESTIKSLSAQGDDEMHLVCSSRDVSNRVKTQNALKENESRFRKVFESDLVGVFFTGAKGVIRDCNEYFLKMTGYSHEDIQAGRLKIDSLMMKRPGQTHEFVRERNNEGGPTLIEQEFIRKDGALAMALIGSDLVESNPENIYTVWFALDITERKIIEEKLKENEERFLQITENIYDVFWIWDAKTDLMVYVNPSYEKVWGRSVDKLLKDPLDWLEAIHPDDRPWVVKMSIQQGKDVLYDKEYRIVMADGSVRWIRDRGYPIRDDDGNVRRVAGIAHDITDKKSAEEQLIQSEAFFKSIFDGVDTMLAVIEKNDDGSLHCVALNNAFRKVVDTENCHILLENDVYECRRLLPQEAGDGLFALLEECLLKQETCEAELSITGEDDLFWWHTRFSPIYNSQGEVFRIILFIHAISDKKREDERNERNQRLESVGILAGGIAHDFNNFLSTIVMNASLVKNQEVIQSKTREYLDDILKVCDEAQQLTKQLLTFARGGAPIKQVTSLAELLTEASRFALRGSQIACEYNIPNDLFRVNADEGQIKQVIYNLALNARQVLGEGGKIKVYAENIELPSTGNQVTKFVSFSVADNGPGIPREVQRNIFNPYFTTKKNGTGLGLAISHSIIGKHGGSIQFSSSSTKGTVFSVTLPATDSQDTSPRRMSENVIEGQGLIVIMDDNDMILNTLAETIEVLGYQAVKTSHGEDCVEAFLKLKANGTRVDALILDLTIQGGIGGVETLRRLKQIDPEVRAIASSGYSEEETMMSFSQMGFKAALPKPYRLAELSIILSEVILKVD